ncbi:MAG: type II secretion system F family protein [Armatimonadetes bacterium]|nr:type II secretion system F family protein [Armatimonadota bacterium]
MVGLITPLLQFGAREIILLSLGGLMLAFMFWSLSSSLNAPVARRQAMSRLRHYIDREENLSPLERMLDRAEAEMRGSKSAKARRKADLLPTVTRWINNSSNAFLNGMASDLTRIGSNWRPSEILYAAMALAAFAFLVFGVGLRMMALGLGTAAAGFAAPFMVVKFFAKRWTARFENQLADTLLLMSNATAAGYGFQQAMEMVAREGMPPMSEEFSKMNQEVRLGVPIADALMHMSERVKNRDMTLTATALIIAMEVGGAISEILRTISETIRERVRIRGEISVLSTQGKMTGGILSALPIFLFFILNVVTRGTAGPGEPPYMDPLFNGKEYPWGPRMVVFGIFSQVTGYMIIQKIVSIDI